MKEYISTSIIDASPEAMWAILTDGGAYREWNPEIVEIDGRIALGGRITAHVRLGDGAVSAVTQRVTALEAPTRMEWVGLAHPQVGRRSPTRNRQLLRGAQASR